MLNVRALLISLAGFLFFSLTFLFLRFAVRLSMSETFTGIFALSGWFAVVYVYLSDRSSIRANLLYVVVGALNNPKHASMASYTAYVYLVNPGKNPVHLLDCELSVKLKGKGWVRLLRVYGKAGDVPVTFDGDPDSAINISVNEVVFQKNKRLDLGVPLYGWAPFVGDIDLVNREVISYKLVSIDAYGRRHVITRSAKKLVNPHLAHELAGVRPPNA